MYQKIRNTIHEIRNKRYEFEITSTSVEKALQISPFYAKQTQLQKHKLMQTQYTQMDKKVYDSMRAKKTNPIQTQTKPISGQYRGWQSQFKAKQSQIYQQYLSTCFLLGGTSKNPSRNPHHEAWDLC